MIPILYDKTGTVKIGDLNDCIECLVEEERNGIFELTMIYPANSSILESIDYDNIIVADANDYLKSQKFRIYNTRKLMANRIEVCARHISFDLVHDWIDVISIENQSCEYALNTIFRNSQFSKHFKGYSDIINAQNFKVNKVTCLEAIGGTSGSIIDTYGTGAEILRDNANIHVLNRRGRDNDVVIEYRKNLTGLEVEEDTTDLVTRIMPYAIYTNSNNEEIEVRGDFIDSPLINNYAHPYVKYMDYSEKFEDDEVPTKTKLNNLAAKEYINNKVDIPKNNYKIEFIPLSKCAGYEGLEDRINLCDVVTVKDSRYNIDTQAKVIKVVFDVLRGRYDSMELGEPRTTLGDIIGGTGDGPTQGPPGPPGPQGPAGADGSIGDFPSTLPGIPKLTTKVYGFANIEVSWTFENKVYYSYELYASKTKGFVPNTFNLIFAGQASTFLHQVNPNETWYYRVCALNTHGSRTEFSNEVSVSTVKIADLSNYVASAAIGDALIGELNLGRGWVGELKGNYIDAKQLSVTDGNGKRTLDIDSFGNVSLDVTSLKISSNDVSSKNYVDAQVNTAQTNAVNASTDKLNSTIKNYYTKSETDTKIEVLNDSITLKANKTEILEVMDDVNSLNLGATNYLTNTNFSKTDVLEMWSSWYANTLAIATYNFGGGSDEDSFIVNKKELRSRVDIAEAIRNNYTYGGFSAPYAVLEKNTTYTLSVWVYIGSNMEKGQIRVYQMLEDDTIVQTLNSVTITDYTRKFKKITLTFTTSNESNIVSIRFYNYFKPSLATGNSDFHIYQPMLSKGAKAKDWVESQDDINNNLSFLTNRITNAELKIEPDNIVSVVSSSSVWKSQAEQVKKNASEISANTNDVSILSTRVKSAEEKITDEAIINTVSDSFYTKSQADDSFSTKTSVVQLSDEINNRVNKIEQSAKTNYINLVVNSNCKNSLEGWYINDATKISTYISESAKTDDKTAVKIDCRNSRVYMNSKKFPVVEGENYTIGLYAYRQPYNDYVRVYMMFSDNDNVDNNFLSEYKYITFNANDGDSKWVYKSFTVTVPQGATRAVIKVAAQSTQTSSEYDGRGYFSSLMCVKGTEAATWCGNSDDSFNDLSKRITTAEQKITDKSIISTVSTQFYNKTDSDSKFATKTQITQLDDEIELKVNKDGVISSINQTSENVKIKAEKIQLEGTATVGKASGDKIKINNADYEIINGSTTKGFFGLRTLDDGRDICRLAMSHSGLDKNLNNYFVMNAYPGSDNPIGTSDTYMDFAYRCQRYKQQDGYGDLSNIRLSANGEIQISPIKELKIYTNFKNGVYPNADSERLIAKFGSSGSQYYDTHMEINAIRRWGGGTGLILGHYNDSEQACLVRVGIDTTGFRAVRPVTTDGNISLGSASYPFEKLTTKNGVSYSVNDSSLTKEINNSDFNGDLDSVLDSLKFTINNGQGRSNSTSATQLNLDISALKAHSLSDVFLNKEKEYIEETNSFEEFCTADMTSMLHLSLYETQKLKEELTKLKEELTRLKNDFY